MVTVNAQAAANRFEAAFINGSPIENVARQEERLPVHCHPRCVPPIGEICALDPHTPRRTEFRSFEAEMAATPKRLPILTLDARKCNLIFTTSLQLTYKISCPAIFDPATIPVS